jgi:nicotinamide-nucleotide amidase
MSRRKPTFLLFLRKLGWIVMKAEIISIGTELLLGQITNTNAQFISEQLAILGIPMYYHSVVGDNRERLLAQLKISTERSDLIIFTGGLGPTKDDLTKETIAQYMNCGLVLDTQAMEEITRFFQNRNIHMTENNQRQALVLEGAHVLSNETGLAPGMVKEFNGKHFILFPGPPKELQPMFLNKAVPYLQSLSPEKKIVYSKVMRFCGIGESALETQLQDLIDQQTSPTIAPLAKEGEVTLRLTCYSSSVEEAEQEMSEVIKEITSRVGMYLYGWNNDNLEDVVVQQLIQKNLTLSIAESCTGGLLSHYVTKVPGASQVFLGGTVCYTDQVKHEQLDVPLEILHEEGAVSSQSAHLLAEKVKEKFQSSIGVSVTGIAGPDTQEGKPVGLVYIGISLPDRTLVKEVRLSGQRQTIQLRATKLALNYIINEIKKG